SDDAPLQLMGKFKLVEKRQFAGEAFDSLALEIEATILDDNDDELVVLEFDVFGSVTLQLAGIDVNLPPQASDAERERVKIEQAKRPATKVDAAEVRPAATSPFGMEVLVVNGNQVTSRPATLDTRGRAFVELHKGEEYAVLLKNDADFEVAVDLAIDGVSAFALAEEAGLRRNLFLVPAHGSYVVPGWFRSLTKTNAFVIGGYAQSVNKQVGGSCASVGKISARFRASWSDDASRPDDEPRAGANAKDTQPPGKATVLGRELQKNYQQVQREFGVVRAVVNIRYDK
ncbi:MAG: hypothetical protein KDA47_23065, partial [Planctomycetales bacterium]|nr:hypothetical protein [Planctomycetales bacterium]